MRRLVSIALACGGLLLWAAAPAWAEPALHRQITGPQWVKTPLVRFSFTMHYGPYVPSPGSPTLAGIAWNVVEQPIGAEPPGAVIRDWDYGESLRFTPPDDYSIEQPGATFELPDHEGRYDLSVGFKAFDDDGGDIGAAAGFGYTVFFDKTAPLTMAPWPASCRRGRWVALSYLLVDGLSPQVRTAVVIKKSDRTVAVLRRGWQPTYLGRFSPTPRTAFKCTLPKGRYRFFVYGTDRAGNVTRTPGANFLTVR